MLLEQRLAEDRDPGTIYAKRCDCVNMRNHPLTRSPTWKRLKQLDFATACDVFNSRLRSPAAWTLVLVGKLPPTSEVLALLEKYVATIPTKPAPGPAAHPAVKALAATHTQDTVSVLDVQFSAKSVPWEAVQVSMIDPQCRVLVSMPLRMEAIPLKDATSHTLRSLSLSHLWRLLETKLCERLRFELGKTYNVSVGDSFEVSSPRPDAARTGMVSISFGCEPGVAETMLKQVLGEIDRLRREGFKDDEVASVKEQERRSIEQGVRENGFWGSTITNLYKSRSFLALGGDIGLAVNNWKSCVDKSLAELSAESARATLLASLPQGGVYTAIVMMPSSGWSCLIS